VILVDVNLLVYAYAERFTQHEAARTWLDTMLSGSAPVGLPWHSLLGFTRIVTNPRILPAPQTVSAAWTQVGNWLDCDTVWIPEPTSRHRDVLGGLLRESGITAKLVPDAHLAALAIEHGLTLCSADGDFARFAGLRWINPLSAT